MCTYNELSDNILTCSLLLASLFPILSVIIMIHVDSSVVGIPVK